VALFRAFPHQDQTRATDPSFIWCADIKNNMLMLSAKPSGSGGEAVDVNAVVLADANAATESTNFTGHAVHMQTREL
jgi:hypothetical protein